ncbi:MAG TPA: HD domain-containing protein [Candidatus Paceibacterota bacterium]|nr:HD domain-containing protein [Candidatus Paceibacterota bacterium]
MDSLNKKLIAQIPKEVSFVLETLEGAGFQAYLVGGCVRDILMEKKPKDWDVTTNAKPDQIIALFEKTVYENTFGTVGVCVPRETSEIAVSQETKAKEPVESAAIDVSPETIKTAEKYEIIEVTPYRTEAKYSDFRHPDEVKFSENIEDDLKRRDFTVNAMAVRVKGQEIELKDIFDGIKDIKSKTLKTVGNPDERFGEDALRMLRAVRFGVQLDFSISHETAESILKNSELIKNISQERIRDEFVKIVMSPNPAVGIVMLQKFNLLKNIIPELEEGINCEQGGEHIYDVWNHLLNALQHAADKNWPLEIRLSALFHDIGKPYSRRATTAKVFSKKKFTFYGHEVVSARMTKKILERLKFSRKEIELVEKLVRHHMFFSDTEKISLSAVRRIITKVGKENIWALMDVRECDRVGMKKKEAPYRLRKYFAMIEEVLHDPISVTQLNIDGNDLLKDIGIKPGPRIGWILNAILEEVLDDPNKNSKGHLVDLAKSLNLLSDQELRTLGERGKEKKEKLEEEEITKLHKKHRVD